MRNNHRDGLLAMLILGVVVVVAGAGLLVYSLTGNDGTVDASNVVVASIAGGALVVGLNATFLTLLAWLMVGAIASDAEGRQRRLR